MDSKDITKKLSAILNTDFQGYSRLMGDNEVATVETITRISQDHHISRHSTEGPTGGCGPVRSTVSTYVRRSLMKYSRPA